MLIAMQRPDATLVTSYKNWQSMGRQVMKGEKGITIIAPAPYKKMKEKEVLDENQRPIMGTDGKPKTEQVEVTVPHFKAVTVFDIAQTSGEPIQTLAPELLTAAVQDFDSFMQAIQKISPVPIRFDEIDGNANGYYHNADKEIVIKKGLSESQTLKTAIHETAHAKLHDKEIMESLGVEKDRLTKEVEAESIAYCVCSSFGLDTSDYSFPYIAGWSSSREMKEMKASMDVIRKTAGEMIDQLTEELEIILEEKQKTELHEKYGILVDALEAAGYRYDYRESEPGHIVLAPDGTHEIAGYLQFESWGDIKDWLEDTIAEQKEVSEMDDVEEIISKISEDSPYKRRPTQKRTWMTVPEKGKLLGLKKTDRYWLVHKNVFESKEIAGKIRINIASFEKWYANQIKYHKVTGEEPGKELKSWSYSVKEVADLLGVDDYLVYELLKKNQMEAVIVDYWKRIPKESFQNWYKSQSRYRTKEDREKDALLEDATITMPEMAQLLGTTRSAVYTILDNPKYSHFFEFIVIAEKKRITKESFQKFLEGQDRYKLDPSNDYEELAQEQNIALANFRRKKLSQTGIRGSNGNIKYLTFDEASYLAKVSRSMINKWADKGKFTKHLPDHLKHTHILNDHRIQTFLIIWKQIIIQLFRQFPVLQQRIHCQIKFPAMDMSSINGTQKLFLSEILRISPRAKGCSPYINRICTCTDRCLKSLIGTGRCQKFNLFSFQFYTSRFL